MIATNFGSISREMWDIFRYRELKVTPNILGLHWNGESKTFWTLPFELLSRNIAPLHFKTERVAVTVLRASWFWQTSARFPETSGVYSSPKDSKVIPDGLGLQWNGHSQFFWTHTFEILGRNIAPLHFKTTRVTKTVLRPGDFDKLRPNFPEFGGYFPLPGSLD